MGSDATAKLAGSLNSAGTYLLQRRSSRRSIAGTCNRRSTRASSICSSAWAPGPTARGGRARCAPPNRRGAPFDAEVVVRRGRGLAAPPRRHAPFHFCACSSVRPLYQHYRQPAARSSSSDCAREADRYRRPAQVREPQPLHRAFPTRPRAPAITVTPDRGLELFPSPTEGADVNPASDVRFRTSVDDELDRLINRRSRGVRGRRRADPTSPFRAASAARPRYDDDGMSSWP